MKKSLVIVLALMLVLAFASSAMAAQAQVNGQYLSTTATGMDKTGSSAGSVFSRTYQENKFTADGTTHYPYEIYLPNEQNPSSYRIHSNYAKNTDACASCHATHTAVGASLLQWYSVYETCMACHDGTLGSATYNVEEGEIGLTGSPASGGMFGNGNEVSLSNHNVTGALEIAAAPGGSTVDTEQVNGAHGSKETRWINEFGCQSCHSPHGQGGNARILNPDANYAASWAAEKRETPNKYFVNPANGKVYSDTAFNTPVYIIKGYPYSPSVIKGNTADATMKIDNTTGTSIVKESNGSATTDATVYVLGVAGLQVKMNISGYLTAGETVTHVYGMNFYCGACHTDYNTAAFTTTGSASQETGVNAQAHRHQMGMDWFSATPGLKLETTKTAPYAAGSMECLTCHVAHGTSQDYWAKTLLGSGQAWASTGFVAADLTELSGSSALKRMPNMGTCEACHAKGDGNEGYNVNAGISAPAGTTNVVDGLMPNTYALDARTANYDAADLGWVGNAKCLGCHEEYVNGWSESMHASSNHTGATSCGRCHNPGNSIMGATGTFATAGVAGTDAGITCEACHGTGARHVKAPSTKNIFNPGKASIERQAIECGKCHDPFANGPSTPDTFGLATVSGMSYNTAVSGIIPQKAKLSTLEGLAGWSVAFRTGGQDPAKFADATQLNATSNHYGGAWGYADSKHFTGTGTTENPNGVVSCNTCHDMHNDKQTGLLRFSYEQVCASCHDSSANLAIAVAMPTNSWNRHQIEANDFAHSFKFGSAATVAAVDIENVNLESASTDFQTFASNTYHYTYAAGNQVSGLLGVGNNTNLWRASQLGGGGIGKRVKAYSDAGKTTRVYNNYEMEWTVTAKPATVTEGTDFVMVPEGGALEFTNPGTGVIADYAKFAGTYTMHYVVKSNPALNGDVSFTIVP